MKTILILLSGVFFLLHHNIHPNQTSPVATTFVTGETVYICNSNTATKYHSKDDCRGLNNCKAEIKSIEKKEAVKLGREECGWCW